MSFFGVCLKTSWFGMYANVLHIPAPSPEEGVASMSISIAYLQRWTAGKSNMTESDRTGVQPYIWESNALKVGRNSAILQSSMDWTAQPRYRTNLVLRTAQTNLTSAAPTASSAAQLLGENEDTYVHSYITQCLRDILDAWDSLKRRENEGQRNCWGRKLKQCRAVNQPPWPGPPKYDVTLWWKSKRQA